MAKAKWLIYSISGLGLVVLATGAAVAYLNANHQPKVYAGYRLGNQELSGTREEVVKQIEAWFSAYQQEEITFSSSKLKEGKIKLKLSEFSPSIDSISEAAKLRYTDFFTEALGQPTRLEERIELSPEILIGAGAPASLTKFIDSHRRPIQKAEARLTGGSVSLRYEASDIELDTDRLAAAVRASLDQDWSAEIPLREAPKRVPDKELKKIRDIVAQFSTTFNAGQIARSANIKLAAETINGLVLMPGESFSFNEFLGKRTPAKGYHAAGVYVSGRHDIDFGGGICQVSTTLYNASLAAGLQVNSRSPHSLPVPYVPLGRDAAVSYPQPDLKISNPYDYPIALAAIPQKGKLTFAILGPAPTARTYQYESKLISTWSNGEKIVHDPSLKFGQRKVVDKGGMGRKVQTWQLVYENGKLLERRNLGVSTYRGGPMIVAINKEAQPGPAATPDPADASVGSTGGQ